MRREGLQRHIKTRHEGMRVGEFKINRMKRLAEEQKRVREEYEKARQKEMEGKYSNEILSLEETIRLLQTEGSSSSGSKTDNTNDSIDDLLISDSEDEDGDRSCSIRQVKVFGRIKGKRSAAEELYSSKMKKGCDTEFLKLIDIEMNKLKTPIRQ